MKALITGASSGIGKDIAYELSLRGYDLVLVSRNISIDDFEGIKTKFEVINLDLSLVENCYKLYDMAKDIDILVNNAGFGHCGDFKDTSLENELNMIDLNIKTVHILTKLYYKKFLKKENKYILNVASSAAFYPGPFMNTYYSTKSYVYKLTIALYEECRSHKYKVNISVLCPGPVNTNFNKVANVEFTVKAMSSKYVSKYAINKMFAKKLVIVPGLGMKVILLLSKFMPLKLVMILAGHIQKKKFKSKK